MTRDYAAEIRARLPEARKERFAAAAAAAEARTEWIRSQALNPPPEVRVLHETDLTPGGQGPFGFNVYHYPADDTYNVSLDHQCDWWQISDRSATKAEAIASLEAFIAEATEALAALKAAP